MVEPMQHHPTDSIPGGPWPSKAHAGFTRDDLRRLYDNIERGSNGYGSGFERGSKRWYHAVRLLQRYELVRYVTGRGWEVTDA